VTSGNFLEMLQSRKSKGANVCVGLDFDHNKMPTNDLQKMSPYEAICRFMTTVVDQTCEVASCYKPNYWFYAGYGSSGIQGLEKVIQYIKKKYPEIPIILDFKGGDIGNTVKMMERMSYLEYDVEAITANPYMGLKNLQYLYKNPDKFVYMILRTSNPEGTEFQTLRLADGRMLYQKLAYDIEDLNQPNVGAVFGATFCEELKKFRKSHPKMKLLIPGIGSQGGDLIKTVDGAFNNFIINSSSGISYANKQNLHFPLYVRNNAEQLNKAIIDAMSSGYY